MPTVSESEPEPEKSEAVMDISKSYEDTLESVLAELEPVKEMLKPA